MEFVPDRVTFGLSSLDDDGLSLAPVFSSMLLILVHDFYANATKREERVVSVRGIPVSYSREAINAILGTPIMKQDDYEQYLAARPINHPTITQFLCDEDIPRVEVMQSVRMACFGVDIMPFPYLRPPAELGFNNGGQANQNGTTGQSKTNDAATDVGN
ncbi:hypothetical protein ACH5RR_025984 [Cinchona calisaya]|uniref:Uncharacterized protein n=1 Tax=Cinchona calisaya TaxID=153742 RepID=A0ABD2Z182_9GENT